MGSRFSADKEKMLILLELVKAKKLFYFDSYTSSATKASLVAREAGVSFAENTIFLDINDDKDEIKRQFQYALKKTIKYGRIAVIGHFSRKYLPEAIKESIQDYNKKGVEFVYLTEIVSKPK
jgi:uncharacterized protein